MCLNITDLSYDWLKTTIEDFGSDGIIFDNEAQFQFELALKIKEAFDCDVYLEDLTLLEESLGNSVGVVVTNVDLEKSAKDNTTKTKNASLEKFTKTYTDIVVKDGKKVVFIELKYKTARADITDKFKITHYLAEQGATDLGRFLYLLDINRLEVLVGDNARYRDEQNIRVNYSNMFRNKQNVERKILKRKYEDEDRRGFAIILTNDEKYWSIIKGGKQNKLGSFELRSCRANSNYWDFCIGQGDSTQNTNDYKGTRIYKDGIMNWFTYSSNSKVLSDCKGSCYTSVKDKFYGRGIKLWGKYVFDWLNYLDYNNQLKKGKTGNHKIECFKFCICEIEKNKMTKNNMIFHKENNK